jgi:fumarate hydratase class II
LGQEWSGYAGMLADDLEGIETALRGVYRLAQGGTAVGTGINSAPGFAEAAAAEIAKLTRLPFVTAPNKFTVQGAHDALVAAVRHTSHTSGISTPETEVQNSYEYSPAQPTPRVSELLPHAGFPT